MASFSHLVFVNEIVQCVKEQWGLAIRLPLDCIYCTGTIHNRVHTHLEWGCTSVRAYICTYVHINMYVRLCMPYVVHTHICTHTRTHSVPTGGLLITKLDPLYWCELMYLNEEVDKFSIPSLGASLTTEIVLQLDYDVWQQTMWTGVFNVCVHPSTLGISCVTGDSTLGISCVTGDSTLGISCVTGDSTLGISCVTGDSTLV